MAGDYGPEPVRWLNDSVRSHPDPIWHGLRRELLARGIELKAFAIAEAWIPARPERVFLACTERSVFQFSYCFPEEDLGAGTIRDWREVTTSYDADAHGPAVRYARDLLASDRMSGRDHR